MSADLIFEEPPAGNVRVGSTGVTAWLAEIRQHPGKWVKFPEPLAPGTAGTIVQGNYRGVRYGEFEARTANSRTVGGKRKADIYARFIGSVQPTAPSGEVVS